MRSYWLLVHRWLGLITALFLFLTGITGAVISWDHELDDWLNPHLQEARSAGAALPPLELARQVEARYPQVRATSIPLHVEVGESLAVFVQPRVDPTTSRLFEPGFNQVFLDPATGDELGKRQWGAVWPISRENVVSFLYKLHFTLHFPEMFGTDRWGIWLLGIIAIGWTLDCFVAFYLTLPARRRERAKGAAADEALAEETVAPVGRTFWQRWRPAWLIRWSGGAYKVNYDLHRAFGLWTWVLLFILAFTAFSLNLYREVFLPMMSTVSKVTPSPFDQRKRMPKHEPIAPQTGFVDILGKAEAEARGRGWTEPAGRAFYNQSFGIYGVDFFHAGADHGAGGVGHKRLYFDGQDGRYLGDRLPWTGTAADIFVQAQFPLHSGRILGLPGRILISVMGVVVAMLSVTGVYIWWKKRRARKKSAAREVARQAAPVAQSAQ
jgi:uncharacterized iron-regulated membrane protein